MASVVTVLLRTLVLSLLLVSPLATAGTDPKKAPKPPPRAEAGIASWFRAKRTLSAAHRTLPIGARVKVRARNGRSVVVTIASRGPFWKGRMIDLSSDAFKKLASLGTGLLRVTLERIP